MGSQMMAVILAGGKGTRISEETKNIPKPMIKIGDKPILHHIMDSYISQGVNEFIIPVGYKYEIIFGYFFGISKLVSHVEESHVVFKSPEWTASVIYSGEDSQTGGRLKRISHLIDSDFYFTYGDGLSNVCVDDVKNFHNRTNSAIATILGVRPISRFGSIIFNSDGRVTDFGEKQEHLSGWINGGFSVLSPKIFDFIDSDDCNLEKDVYPKLADTGSLFTVTHDGFWHCVDTLRDWESLSEIYENKGAIWVK